MIKRMTMAVGKCPWEISFLPLAKERLRVPREISVSLPVLGVLAARPTISLHPCSPCLSTHPSTKTQELTYFHVQYCIGGLGMRYVYRRLTRAICRDASFSVANGLEDIIENRPAHVCVCSRVGREHVKQDVQGGWITWYCVQKSTWNIFLMIFKRLIGVEYLFIQKIFYLDFYWNIFLIIQKIKSIHLAVSRFLA